MKLPPWLGAKLGLVFQLWLALGLVLGHWLRLSLGLRFCFALFALPCAAMLALNSALASGFSFVGGLGFALGSDLT